MAEFCKQCAEELDFEPDFTNLFKYSGSAPVPERNVGFTMLCESCGLAFIVDDEGTCGAWDCDREHGKPYA